MPKRRRDRLCAGRPFARAVRRVLQAAAAGAGVRSKVLIGGILTRSEDIETFINDYKTYLCGAIVAIVAVVDLAYFEWEVGVGFA
jgi:hypothetical protein